MKESLLTTLCALLLSASTFSQTIIWSENFDSYANGTTTGAGSSWTSSCGGCLSGDYFEVRSGLFSGGDVNAFSTWQSESIDISGYTSVLFSLDAIEVGDHEGPGCGCGVNIDYIDVYYSINGGPFIVIEDWNGDGEPGHTLTGDSQNGSFTDADWGTTTVSQGGLSGTSLVLQVQMRNTSGSEVLSIDNVIVLEEVPLPIELITFEGESLPEGNAISWKTASELDNSHFILEASMDLQTFEAISVIPGAGTTNEVMEYGFIDRESTGTTYYRLQQIDFDGAQSFSPVISVSREPESKVYPNPFNDHLFIELEEESTLTLYSIDGKQLSQTLELPEGNHDLTEIVSSLPSGMLFIRIENGRSHQTYHLRKL
jgi:hypothetical protein